MDIPVELPAGDPQRRFLDFFQARLRSHAKSSSGESTFLDDGSFRTIITGGFQFDEGAAELRWTITREPNGEIDRINVELAGDDATRGGWEKTAQDFVVRVLTSALTEDLQTFFRRQVYRYIGPTLSGEYWLPGFRFAPAIDEDELPSAVNFERAVFIELSVNAIDDLDANAISDQLAREHASRLSLFLDIGLYKAAGYHGWVLAAEEGQSPRNERRQVGYFPDASLPNALPDKGALCGLGEFKGSISDEFRALRVLTLPAESRRILRHVADDTRFGIAFDSCARLYQVALNAGRQYPTVNLAYKIAAVEAIANANAEGTSFSDFMRKHANLSSDYDDFLQFLYGNVRSGHFHSGAFPLGDFLGARFDFLMDSDALTQHHVQFQGHRLLRRVIANWILEALPPVQ